MKQKYYSNIKRLKQIKDEGIDYSDIPEMDEAFFEKAVIVLPRPKVAVCIRLDQDVLDWFKSQGKGIRPGLTLYCGLIWRRIDNSLTKARGRKAAKLEVPLENSVSTLELGNKVKKGRFSPCLCQMTHRDMMIYVTI